MSSLAELQTAFARALRDPDCPAPAGLRLGVRAGARRRFDVYRNNMVVSLVDALRTAFPAVLRLVGEAYFTAAARAYVDRYPPDSPVLLHYGRQFGALLDSLPSAAGVPYLGDVARLEWARRRALHAADVEITDIQTLAAISEACLNRVTVALHPALSWLDSRWPVVSLWAASVDAGDAADVDMKAPQHAVVVRPALRVQVYTAAPGGADFLAALAAGRSLGAAAATALAAHPSFDLAAQLRFIFEIGAVSAVNAPAAPDRS